jgi:YVTN family beta-propeller protein
MKRLTIFFLAISMATILLSAYFNRATSKAQKRSVLPNKIDESKATVLPNGWRVTPAGRHIRLPGDLPMKMLIAPDGKSLLVNTGGFHDHSVNIIDLASEKLTESINVGKNWAGMCLDPKTGTIYVSGGGVAEKSFASLAAKRGATAAVIDSFNKPVLRLSQTNGKLALQPALEINGLASKERFVAGITYGTDGSLYVINTGNDTIYRLNGARLSVGASAKVGYRPYAATLSADGKRLAVSNWGDESVSLLDAATLRETARVRVGNHPNELVFGRDGRLFVANSGSNSVSVISGDKIIETIKTSLDPQALVGSTPVALALSPDNARLYVANADNNDVAVIDTSNARESRVLGFIPTGWYPSALAVSPDGQKLYIGTGKGLGFRANVPAITDFQQAAPDPQTKYDYIGAILSGAVSIVDAPDSAQLAAYTRQVVANTPQAVNQTHDAQAFATTARNAFRKIKHVLFIIRENRTYDQVFGDLGVGNGDSRLTLFGNEVTPNAHKIARRHVVFDNLYCNGEVSEDGHQWCNAAYATDFVEKAWPNNYSKRGEPEADERLTASPAGYLWDNCARHGLSYRSYGEFASFKSDPNSAPKFTGQKGLEGHASLAWLKIKARNGRDTEMADVFISELHEAEKNGDWPNFMVMSLGEDHTEGLKAGAYTPISHVANNDQALGKIVEAVSRSRFWPETAIFVIEDDAQNGPDHVDAHRTVGLLISPYARRDAVDSTMYTTASFVRTMELILGLPPMTQYDAAATPMYKAFTDEPLLSVIENLPARVDLEARNPQKGTGVEASARLDFSDYDRADPDALNEILWQALRPRETMPASVRSAQLSR